MSVLDRDALQASPLADLHAIASELSIDGYRRLRKAQLIDTILDKQSGVERPAADDDEPGDAPEAPAPSGDESDDGDDERSSTRRRRGRRGGRGRSRADSADGGESDDGDDERRSTREERSGDDEPAPAKAKKPEPKAATEPEAQDRDGRGRRRAAGQWVGVRPSRPTRSIG